MEQLEKTEHQDDQPSRPDQKMVENDRFQHIKEMIELPEEDVSATREPREADDSGLPLMLMLIIGVVLVLAGVDTLLWLTLGNDVVSLTLGNHFTK